VELRQLRHFLSIVRHGNLHRAAEELHISQQALSTSISRLEQDLGVQLLLRGRHGAELTHCGEALLPRAQSIVGEARTARAELQGLGDATRGHVRAGVGAFFAQHVFPEALMRFVAAYPRVDVTVIDATSSDLYLALARGELDLVVSTPAAEVSLPPQFESELLFETTDAIFIGADHPLAKRSAIRLEDLVDQTWIVSARFDNYRHRIETAFRAAGMDPPSRIMRTDSVPLIGQVLNTSPAVALLGRNPTDSLALPVLGRLKAFDLPELSGPYRGVMAWRRTALLPAAARLIEAIRECTRRRMGTTAP
jgi:DNA-binding transcriptional LysR family regulator